MKFHSLSKQNGTRLDNWRKISYKSFMNKRHDSQRLNTFYIEICEKLLTYSQGNAHFLLIKTQASIEMVVLHLVLILILIIVRF